MKNLRLKHWMSMLLVIFFLAACSGGSGTDSIETSSNTGTVASAHMGTLSLGLIDKSTDEYQAVYVTINEVQVHRCDAEVAEACEGTWITVATPDKTYNLLELVNGVIAMLGVAELESGYYSQMRLYLGDMPDNEENILGESHPFPHYVILDNPESESKVLKVPSGYQSGIKLVRGFEIDAGVTIDLVLDFDADKSVVKAGKSGKYLLKPTIKVIDTLESATLSGMVTTIANDEPIGLGGVPVSAQTYDQGLTEDPKDQKDWVSIYTTTFTAEGDEDLGQYMMFLPPGNYNIVAYEPGFVPQCRPVTVGYGDVLAEDFELAPADIWTVSVVVEFDPVPETAPTVTISYRQTCEGGQDFEVVSQSGESPFTIELPSGVCEVVASAEGRETIAVSLPLDPDALDPEDALEAEVNLTLSEP